MANKLYFIKPNDWEVCHLHHWGVIQTSYPGIELQLGESGYYECDISELYTTENIENNPILYLQLNHNGKDSVFNSTETNNGEALLNDMSGRIYEVKYVGDKLFFKKPSDWTTLWAYVYNNKVFTGFIELTKGTTYYEWDVSQFLTSGSEETTLTFLLVDTSTGDWSSKYHQSMDLSIKIPTKIGTVFELNTQGLLNDLGTKTNYTNVELVCIGRVTEDEPDEPDEPDIPVEPEEPKPVEPTFDCGLMKHLPEYWHQNLEMQEILKRQCEEFKLYVLSQEPVFTDSFILQASEDRIVEWEKKLGITGNGTLDERRQVIFSMLYSIRKLDEATIKELVRLNCSNADCNVRIKNSNIDVEVLPTSHNGYYNFANLNRVLNIKKPAHLGLKVYFYECTWGEIKKNFSTWNDVKTYGNWSDVNTYLAYLEG